MMNVAVREGALKERGGLFRRRYRDVSLVSSDSTGGRKTFHTSLSHCVFHAASACLVYSSWLERLLDGDSCRELDALSNGLPKGTGRPRIEVAELEMVDTPRHGIIDYSTHMIFEQAHYATYITY